MMSNRSWILWIVVVLMGVSGVAAQDSCPTIVDAALVLADQSCAEVGRNQACYGHEQLDAKLKPESALFSASGDLINLADVESLTVGNMDGDGHWGIALLKVQASLAETLPGQNVTMLLFGQVAISETPTEANAVVEESLPESTPVSLQVTASSNVNVREAASTNATVIGSLSAGNSLTAIGRNADGSWLRVELPDGNNGWVSAQVVTLNGDANALPEVSEYAPAVVSNPVTGGHTPLHAFYFTTGIGDSKCKEAPDSGILMQSPAREHKRMQFVANGVEIDMGSTIYMQAQPAGDMLVSVIGGEINVRAGGTTVMVPEGTRVRIPLDANGIAAGAR